MTETHIGSLIDSLLFASLDVAQFDEIPFYNIVKGNNLSTWKNIILKELNIDYLSLDGKILVQHFIKYLIL